MRQKNIIIFFIVFILNIGYSFGQEETVSKLDYYKELKGTQINDILPDSKGNIWIASLGGLVKFDGYEFHWYHNDPEDNKTIGGLLTYALFEDSKGRIWIGSMGYIYCYIPQTKLFETYSLDVDFPVEGQPFVGSIVEDVQGKVYFGVSDGMGFTGTNALLYFDEEKDEMKGFEDEVDQEIENVFLMQSDPGGGILFNARNGVFFINTNGELNRIPDEVFYSTLSDNEFPIGVVTSSDGFYWFISNRSNLHKFKTQKVESSWSLIDVFEGPVSPNFSAAITLDSEENILICGSQGLITFDRKSDSYSIKKFDSDLRFDPSLIRVIKYDLFGNLWMGSESQGLFKVPNRNILKSYTHDPKDSTSIAGGWIARIFEDSEGIIFMPSNNRAGGEGLNRLDPATGILSRTLYKDIIPGFHNIYMIDEIRPGEFFFESNGEYYVYNIKTNTIDNHGLITNVKELGYVNDVIRDSKDVLWICTLNGLFRESDGMSERFTFSEISQSDDNSNHVTLIMESKENGIWTLTNNGLFFIHNNSDLIERHGFDSTKGDVFSTQDINSLYEDDNGILWVGTWQGGLNRYDPELKKVKVYDLDDGLPNMSIQGILGDEKNNVLWLSTFAGLSRFNIEEEQFNNFSTEDGAQGRLFADGSYLKTSQGLFVFGGSNGINIFDPHDITENSIPPKLYITDFKAGNESLAFVDATDLSKTVVELVHDQNNISISYLGIHYDDPSKNKFAFKLDNFDSDWRNVGNQRSAYYYNLPPGNYTFNVKSANSYGVWNKENASLHFSISPPWWMTWWAYSLYAVGSILFILLFDRYRKRRLIEKEREKTKEKELAQAKEIEKAYENLKTTQSQLIQSEKMASLGELTAGIAHEIQNPMNFINNFSEVSIELMDEMRDELDKGDVEEAKTISKDIAQNLDKITHHGKRASSIVKGMLEHSRSTSGQKELTDINVLADEYLRLAYHGLRAKNKSFNADFKTDLDNTLPKIEVIPQDLGRVLLNLINNAFYAVTSIPLDEQDKNYKPLVTVSTKKLDDQVLISVKDNGPGIPDDIKEKIFQPFFTTKPTGKGTGLGLSLAYDIITQGHGGALELNTKPGEGTEFLIYIPLSED